MPRKCRGSSSGEPPSVLRPCPNSLEERGGACWHPRWKQSRPRLQPQDRFSGLASCWKSRPGICLLCFQKAGLLQHSLRIAQRIGKCSAMRNGYLQVHIKRHTHARVMEGQLPWGEEKGRACTGTRSNVYTRTQCVHAPVPLLRPSPSSRSRRLFPKGIGTPLFYGPLAILNTQHT